MKFEFTGDTQSGIFRYFWETSRDEYFDIVKTYATSMYSSQYKPEFAITFDTTSYWHAKEYDPIGNYIVVYLPNFYINIYGYSITSSHNNPSDGVCHPKNWGFDASNDNITWENQVNFSDIGNSMNVASASKFVGWCHGTYKYFRIMITGPAYDIYNKNSIDLRQIELFGELTSHISQYSPCDCFFHHIIILFPMYVFLSYY